MIRPGIPRALLSGKKSVPRPRPCRPLGLLRAPVYPRRPSGAGGKAGLRPNLILEWGGGGGRARLEGEGARDATGANMMA